MSDIEKKTVAVCICTSGVRSSLIPCLLSLTQQVIPDTYQMVVVVVDNSVTGDVKSTIVSSGIFSEELIFCQESRAGIPLARNAALRMAVKLQAHYIAFIDDDEIAPQDWLTRLVCGIVSNGADVIVGGVGRSDSIEGAVKSAADYVSSEGLSDLPRVRTAVTSNVLLDARLVLAPLSLNFDENMYFGGSDREFFMRAILGGSIIVSAKNELVFEVWPAERREVKYLLMRWFRYGASFNYRYCKNLSPIKGYALVWLMFLYKMLGSPVKLLTLPIRSFWDKRPLRILAGMSVADIAYGLGCIAPFFSIRPNKYY